MAKKQVDMMSITLHLPCGSKFKVFIDFSLLLSKMSSSVWDVNKDRFHKRNTTFTGAPLEEGVIHSHVFKMECVFEQTICPKNTS